MVEAMALRVELDEVLEWRAQTGRELQAMMILLRGVAALLESELGGAAPEVVERPRVKWWSLWRR
jgi:hypothetical protein